MVVQCVLMLQSLNKWKPLRTNHKWLHSFTLIAFLRENELFQRSWEVFATLLVIPEGWEGHQFPAKMENPGKWEGWGPK